MLDLIAEFCWSKGRLSFLLPLCEAKPEALSWARRVSRVHQRVLVNEHLFEGPLTLPQSARVFIFAHAYELCHLESLTRFRAHLPVLVDDAF